MRDGKAGCLQDLIALAVTDVDCDRLEMQRLALLVSHEARIDIGPQWLAVPADESAVKAKPWRIARHYAAPRALGLRDIVGVRESEQRPASQLGIRAAKPL